MPVIEALGRWKQDGRSLGHSQLREFRTSPGYLDTLSQSSNSDNNILLNGKNKLP